MHREYIMRYRRLFTDRTLQLVWLLVAVPVVSLALAGIEPYVRLLTTTCTGAQCLAAHLTEAEAVVTTRAGWPPTAATARLWTYFTLAPAVIALGTAAWAIWRRFRDPAAVVGAFGLLALSASEFAAALVWDLPALRPLVISLEIVRMVGLILCVYLVPDGRVQSRQFGWVALAVVLAAVILALDHGMPTIRLGLGLGLFALPAARLIARYRALPDSLARERVVWAIAALALFVAAQLLGRPLRPLPLPALPLDVVPSTIIGTVLMGGMLILVGAVACLAMALLHDELFAVELVLNRALVYSLLSLFVVAGYVLVVGYLSLLFHDGGTLWFSLIATGVVAALFHPIRARVQGVVNHLLYGARDEPYAVMAQLGRQLEAGGEPAQILAPLAATLGQLLRLPYVDITTDARLMGSYRAADQVGTAPTSDMTEQLRLTYRGRPVGTVNLRPRVGEAQLTPADRRLLADLAPHLGVAVHAAQTSAEVKRARERIVSGREEERRRLRRDLHDGLGPQLAGQALALELVARRLRDDPDGAAALLAQMQAQTREAVRAIRDLVDGLRPPALDDLGLAGAIRATAEGLAPAQASPHIHVQTLDDLPPLRAAVEVAAYRIAQEALTNVVRHAGARSCRVRLSIEEAPAGRAAALCVEVVDDGAGFDDGRPGGVGLHSMRERAAELGGRLSVERCADGGTLVRALLPLGSSGGEA